MEEFLGLNWNEVCRANWSEVNFRACPSMATMLQNQAIVIVSFANPGTEDVFQGHSTKAARKACPLQLWKVAGRKLDQLDSVMDLDELRNPPGNQLEALRRDRAGQHGIRINDQYRICFLWTSSGPSEVEIVDYH